MPLPLPNLDNRTYEQLRTAALQQIETNLNTDWNDLGPGDPGVVLLEAFAYLTEQMLYRLNRVPEKLYIAFLRLLGVTLFPPTAAHVELRFWQSEERDTPILVPRGTRVTMGGGSGEAAPIFVTAAEVEVKPTNRDKESAVTVTAYHCDLVEEPLGVGTGRAGLTFTVQQPPLVANVPPVANVKDAFMDLVVGVELLATEQATATQERVRIGANGKLFQLWDEVENFSGFAPKRQVYTVDRQAGLIQFAPAARLKVTDSVAPLAAIPANGREIRIWYARGGGAAGNVRAGVLDTVVAGPNGEALQGLTVTNPARATGGMDAESVENALIRGPHAVYAHQRVVTARDYERTVLDQQRVKRAKAYAMGDLWRHAIPGTVQVTLVPRLDDPPTHISRDLLRQSEAEHEQRGVVEAIRVLLEAKSPLGTRIAPTWARYKEVTVHANLVVTGDADPEKVKERVLERLYHFISPLPSPDAKVGANLVDNLPAIAQTGWPFGQDLRVLDVYRLILADQPTATFSEPLQLTVEAAPDRAVTSVVADHFQPHTWYAASENRLLRSANNGDGWEQVLTLTDETVTRICANPNQPGMVAAAMSKTDADEVIASALYLSVNCGESWYRTLALNATKIHDMAWRRRDSEHLLLVATNKGLYEVNLRLTSTGKPADANAKLIPVLEDPNPPGYPLYAVTVLRREKSEWGVAVALQDRQGVYFAPISERGGADLAFKPLKVDHLVDTDNAPDFRHLNVQTLGSKLYLWAGAMAVGDLGKGCYRWQLDEGENPLDEGENPFLFKGRWMIPTEPAEGTDSTALSADERRSATSARSWTGGSCYALVFYKSMVLAVTAWGGLRVLTLDPNDPDTIPPWQGIKVDKFPRLTASPPANPHQRVPLVSDEFRQHSVALTETSASFLPLHTIDVSRSCAENEEGEGAETIMVGGDDGVYRVYNVDGDMTHVAIKKVSEASFTQMADRITFAAGWLPVSGKHEVDAKTYTGWQQQAAAERGKEPEQNEPEQKGALNEETLATPAAQPPARSALSATEQGEPAEDATAALTSENAEGPTTPNPDEVSPAPQGSTPNEAEAAATTQESAAETPADSPASDTPAQEGDSDETA